MAVKVRLRIAGKVISTLFGATFFAREVAAEALQGVVKSTVRARETVMRRSVRMGDSSKGRSTATPIGRAGGSPAKVHRKTITYTGSSGGA